MNEAMMRSNEGMLDRAFRMLLGLALISLSLFGDHYWGLIGFVPLLTGLLGSCPVYALLGISTCHASGSATH